ncbi:unnamed protein product [Periconia digitata]|uniref:Uncharacterized protein n=1 Tax=Periconia digitata TaxID=1303443 RepID=A0A9W4UNX2_9PLEO|nr:unnamed protein product [Periconia digitata]
MLNAYDPPFPKNYVCIVASEPYLYSAFFRALTDLASHNANLKPLSLQIVVE